MQTILMSIQIKHLPLPLFQFVDTTNKQNKIIIIYKLWYYDTIHTYVAYGNMFILGKYILIAWLFHYICILWFY